MHTYIYIIIHTYVYTYAEEAIELWNKMLLADEKHKDAIARNVREMQGRIRTLLAGLVQHMQVGYYKSTNTDAAAGIKAQMLKHEPAHTVTASALDAFARASAEATRRGALGSGAHLKDWRQEDAQQDHFADETSISVQGTCLVEG